MNLALMTKRGLPMDGLIAMYDPYQDILGRNVLPVGSENFVTGWTAGTGAAVMSLKANMAPANSDNFVTGWTAYAGATVTVMDKANIMPAGSDNFVTGWFTVGSESILVGDYPTTIPGVGAVIAKRISGNGAGNSVIKWYNTVTGRPNPHTDACTVWVKKLAGNALLSLDGALSGATAITSDWQRLTNSKVQNDDSSAVAFLTDSATDVLDIVVYQPMINPNTATAWPTYIPPQQGYPDTDGGTKAVRILSAGGASSNKYYLRVSGLINPHNEAISCYVSVLSGTIRLYGVNGGTAKTSSAWERLSVSGNKTQTTTDLFFDTSNAANNMDILAYQPMIDIATQTLNPYVPPQQGYPDPEGGNNAYRVVTAGGSSVVKYYCVVSGLANPHTAISGVWGKQASSGVKFAAAGGTPVLIPPNWTRLSNTSVNRASAQDDMEIITAAAGDSVDIYLYKPQMNIGSVLASYTAPSGLPQSILDRSGKGNNAQNGSAATADTNDPIFSGTGVVFGTDDFLKCAQAVFDDLQRFTVITVFRANSLGGSNSGKLFDKTQRNVSYSAGNKLFFTQVRSGSDIWRCDDVIPLLTNVIAGVSYNATTPEAAPAFFINQNKSANITRPGTGTGGLLSDAAVDLHIGNSSAANRFFDGTIYLQIWYKRILSDQEYLRAYSYLLGLMAQRGVTI